MKPSASNLNPDQPDLTAEERETYAWQMWIPGFGEAGQRRLKNASVMISRCGGVGGAVAYQLAAAGVGRLVLAHAGTLKPSDLNRQLLMTHEGIGKSRMASITRRLKELNPRLEIHACAENVQESNAASLVALADVVVDCAPLFEERFLMNRECVRQGKPMVECAMYELEGTLTVFIPGQTPCLACLTPEKPAWWKRQFPVFGAVAGTMGSLGAVETIKLLSGLGEPLVGTLLSCDLKTMQFRRVKVQRDPACPVCRS